MKASLFCGAAVLMAIHAPAMAQTAASASDPSAGADGSIQDIVVTAQRRSERAQDVPIAIAAINSDGLTRAGVQSVEDLGQVVPSLAVSNAVGYTIVHLRGVGASILGPGLENPVAFYVDGVYYASRNGTLFDLSNIERVEVLKGPQGTLFGRNSTAGLIQIITEDPGDTFKMKAHVGYGNFQTLRGDLYAGGAISENLAADFSIVGSTMGKGFGKNLVNGHDVYRNHHNIMVRSKLVFTPSDRTKMTLIGDYSDQRNSFNAPKLYPGSISPLLNVPPCNDGNWDVCSNLDQRLTNTSYGVSLKIEQDLGFATLSNQTAYRHSRTLNIFDVDFTALPHLDARLSQLETQFSNELQLSSNGSGPLKWVAGLYYFDSIGQYDPSGVGFNNPATNPLPFGWVSQDTFGRQKTKAIAGYVQATYEIMSGTNVTGGIRYSDEKRSIYGSDTIFLGDGTVALTIPYAKRKASFNKPTFRVAIDHRLSPEIMAYISFNTGFKSGGFNTQTPGRTNFLPETIKAYEVGLKTDLFDKRVRANFAAFYYDYRNIQVQKNDSANTGLINGAKARVYGAEAEVLMNLSNRLTLNMSASMLDSKYDEFLGAPFGSPGGGVPQFAGDASGNYFPKAPKFQGIFGANYAVPIGSGSIELNGNVSYNSGYFMEPDNVLKQPRYAKVNGSVTWTSSDKRLSARLWGNNLTNKAILAYGSTIADGSQNISFEAPRTYGITLGYTY